jgi:serine/threonine protein kinase
MATISATMSTPHGPGKIAAPEEIAAQDMRLASNEMLLGTAAQVIGDISDESNVFDPSIEDRIPKFNTREIVYGHIIGRGGFCVVRDVVQISTGKSPGFGFSCRNLLGKKSPKDNKKWGISSWVLNKKSKQENAKKSFEGFEDGNDEGRKQLKFSREYVASKSKKTRSNGGRYVIKTLSADLDKINYMKGNVDIALEAKFLSVLDHTNVIELVGVSKTEACSEGYFLVLEKMTKTLTQTIKGWMDQDRMNTGLLAIFPGRKKREYELYRERIAASYDIANGLYYLHSKNIIFRDLVSLFDCFVFDIYKIIVLMLLVLFFPNRNPITSVSMPTGSSRSLILAWPRNCLKRTAGKMAHTET